MSIDEQLHGVHVLPPTIRWQGRHSEAEGVFCAKLVKEIGFFLREIEELAMLAELHLVGADHLLQLADVVNSASSKMVGDLTPWSPPPSFPRSDHHLSARSSI